MTRGIVAPIHHSSVLMADRPWLLQAVEWKIFSLQLESALKHIQRVFPPDQPYERLLRAPGHARRHAIPPANRARITPSKCEYKSVAGIPFSIPGQSPSHYSGA